MDVENTSTVRVDHTLHDPTTVRGAEEHNFSVITPLQAMLVCNDFTADDIQNINDAEADRHRQERGFTPLRNSSDTRYYNRGASDASGASDAHGASDASDASDANGASDAIGATDAYGAPVANPPPASRGSRHGDMHTEAPSSSKSRKLTKQDVQDSDWANCWVRPCRYMPPSASDFETASRKANLNEGQRHAMTITGKHRLALVRGPPGTGKTQMSSAVIDAWARNAYKNEIIIASGPSTTATDNLLETIRPIDRIVSPKDRRYRIGRLGEGKSVFDKKRVIFSLTDQAMWLEGRNAKKSVINRTVRRLISERKQSVIFATYMKSAELHATDPAFTLADEAGQATEPTTAVLLACAVEGGHVMIVGDEHQLAPTVKDQRADWDGLGSSLSARLNRDHEGLGHVVMLEIQYRMHPDIQSFPNVQYYDEALLCGLTRLPPVIEGIPWPPCNIMRPGTGHSGQLESDPDPVHRVLYIHCSGQETPSGNSPSNRMQANAVEYIPDKVHARYTGLTPMVLVLTPYKGQHELLSHTLAKYWNDAIRVSITDAAQGQEADLVIITFARANATGSVGFTDDAKRPNVAITRKKQGSSSLDISPPPSRLARPDSRLYYTTSANRARFTSTRATRQILRCVR